MTDDQKPFLADLVMSYKLCGERQTLQLLKEFVQDVVTCTRDEQGRAPKGLAFVLKVIEEETNSAWVEGR